MNKLVKESWLKALRSGQYKKGHGRLRSTSMSGQSHFCCLGVLCDLYSKEKGLSWSVDADDPSCPTTFLREHFLLPKEVAEWSGLNTPRPSINDIPIDNINDGVGAYANNPQNFDQIATLIEENF